MRLVIADEALASLCEDPTAGTSQLGPEAFESLGLVLDVIAPEGVDLGSLAGLRFLSVQVTVGTSARVVITTKHVRVTFIPLINTSTGGLAMFSDHDSSVQRIEALQLHEIVGLAGTAGALARPQNAGRNVRP